MKKSIRKYFHIRIRLILVLAGATVAFFGFLELALSKSILGIFVVGYGYFTVVIGIWALKPRYSLLRKISTSFGLLFTSTVVGMLFSLFLASTYPFLPSPISWLGLSMALLVVASSFVVVLLLPTAFKNVLRLFALRNIRNLIVSFLVVYICLILFFALCYANVYKFIPDSFGASQSLSFFDITYYSVVTITTLGYGDIRALHWVPRLLSMIEVIVGLGLVVIYVGITAAILLRENLQKK